MIFEHINIWAVLVSSVAAMLIGATWYGPVFGKYFLKESGMDKWSKKQQKEEAKKMPRTFLLQFLAYVVTVGVVSWILGELRFAGVAGGIVVSLIVWGGVIVPIKLGEQLWGGKFSLFWLGAGCQLVTTLAVGAIIGAWR